MNKKIKKDRKIERQKDRKNEQKDKVRQKDRKNEYIVGY